MNFPKIPEIPKITHAQAVIELLDSVINEENALSSLLKAEAEKNLNLFTNPSHDHVIEYCHSTCKVIESICMKEWLLYQKLHQILQIKTKIDQNQSLDGGKNLKSIEFEMDRYHHSLEDAQQAVNEYYRSIGNLFDGVQTIKNGAIHKESKSWLTLTVHNLIEMQRMLMQKDMMVNLEAAQDLFTMTKRNMTSLHLKSTESLQPRIDAKYEPPLKPWLSQKVYRHYD